MKAKLHMINHEGWDLSLWFAILSPLIGIPGTSSVQHLRENLAAAELALSGETLARLHAINTESEQTQKA